MDLDNQDYIIKNRLKESMITMSRKTGVSYLKIRKYMTDNNILTTKEERSIIKVASYYKTRYANKSMRIHKGEKEIKDVFIAPPKVVKTEFSKWNYDALP